MIISLIKKNMGIKKRLEQSTQPRLQDVVLEVPKSKEADEYSEWIWENEIKELDTNEFKWYLLPNAEQLALLFPERIKEVRSKVEKH